MKINEIFTTYRYKLNTHFDSYLIQFPQSISICLYHHLSLLLKNYGLKKIAIHSKSNIQNFFYSCIFDSQYTKVLNNGIAFILQILLA